MKNFLPYKLFNLVKSLLVFLGLQVMSYAFFGEKY